MQKPQDSNKEGGLARNSASNSGQPGQPAHFADARRIVESWPEWKRNICSRSTGGENGPTASPGSK